MSQSVNLSFSGLFTSMSDFNGLPPGAANVADNIESRFKNVFEPRRGFEGILGTEIDGETIRRMINFYVDGVDRIVVLTTEDEVAYYVGGVDVWGNFPGPGGGATNIIDPDPVFAKSRFIIAGQNLYVTSKTGVRSLASGSGSIFIRAGVPRGLNLEAVTNGDTAGFLNNNVVLSTTGNTTSASAIVTNLNDTTSIEVGQYVSGSGIPAGTKILSVTPEASLIIQTGNTTAGSATIANLVSNAGIVAGVLVSGTGIPEGAKVVSISGAGPYAVVLDLLAYQTQTAANITFTSPLVVTLDQNAGTTLSATALKFFTGSQVGYRMVFGRVESDIDGGTVTRLGAPSQIAIASNLTPYSTNVVIRGTIPKLAQGSITFVQLYRSIQTSRIDITPLDQYNLVYERNLEPSDFTARIIEITDEIEDSLKGIPLYSGSDREGILQSNDSPPVAWDVCKFRDFTLFGNITRPSTLQFSLLASGPPSGVQVGDVITISGTFQGVAITRTYTGAATENQAAHEFKVFTAGTPSQDITDTTDSLIRVINFDEGLPVHAVLLSTSSDLGGQILLQADYPSLDTFSITASAHAAAFDPGLTDIGSELNNINNGVGVSKLGELEAVPDTNIYRVGDSSSEVLRLVPQRDYVICIKTDGIYKIQGTTPNSLVVTPFDLTTKIIGPDTAVSLNGSVWMLSNQGVVSISDGGVDAKSIPIDDQLNRLAGNHLANLNKSAFAIGYESDRKYILCVPDGADLFANTQYNFNYLTSTWTTWSRNFYTGFIHSNLDRLYVSRADTDAKGISVERKTSTFRDYADEALFKTVTAQVGTLLTLSDVTGVEVGDIFYQDDTHFSAVLSVDLVNTQITVQHALAFTLTESQILKSYQTDVTWKQVFGDNPAFMRQFSEGMFLFKNTGFNSAVARFVTDFSQGVSDVDLLGSGGSLYGLFPWGEVPWGGASLPSKIRFLIPEDKQIGSYLIPSLRIKSAYSGWRCQGLSITYFSMSSEAGIT